MSGIAWTTQEVRDLARHVRLKTPRPQISKLLGRGEASIRSQIQRMGLRTRQQRNWDDTQDMDMLERISLGHSCRRVAFDMDRTERQIRARLAYLDIKLRGKAA